MAFLDDAKGPEDRLFLLLTQLPRIDISCPSSAINLISEVAGYLNKRKDGQQIWMEWLSANLSDREDKLKQRKELS